MAVQALVEEVEVENDRLVLEMVKLLNQVFQVVEVVVGEGLAVVSCFERVELAAVPLQVVPLQTHLVEWRESRRCLKSNDQISLLRDMSIPS